MESSNQALWKRIIKCGVSLCVFAVSESSRTLLSVAGIEFRGRCLVLYYHSVPARERKAFAKQMDTLLLHSSPIVLGDTNAFARGAIHTAITFDDAFENFVTEAWPELEKRKLSATVFVIADALGKSFGPVSGAEKIMSLEQLRSLPRDRVSIGSHTLSHPMLTRVTEMQARREIVESRGALEKFLGRGVCVFSFPFGDFNHRLVELCKDAGYDRVFTTVPTWAFQTKSEFAVGRVRVDPSDWPLEFRLKIAGAYRWIPLVVSLKQKLFSRMVRKKRGSSPAMETSSMIRE